MSDIIWCLQAKENVTGFVTDQSEHNHGTLWHNKICLHWYEKFNCGKWLSVFVNTITIRDNFNRNKYIVGKIRRTKKIYSETNLE
jgi:hypothetical protein